MPRAQATRRSPAGPGVHAYDMGDAPWRELPRNGVREKAVRRDAATGHYLGMVAFDPMTRSGLHQHLGTALSYFLSGSLTDYQGSASTGMAGINLAGATHDAITYSGCLLAARLEGPVVVPDASMAAHPIHGGSAPGRIVNPHPERWPEINIPVEPLPLVPTALARVGRRQIFDYAGTGDVRRFVALTLLPGAPAFRARHEGLTDWFVIAGDVRLDATRVGAASFVVIEPGAERSIASEYGCTLLAWAEAPARVELRDGEAELYGF